MEYEKWSLFSYNKPGLKNKLGLFYLPYKAFSQSIFTLVQSRWAWSYILLNPSHDKVQMLKQIWCYLALKLISGENFWLDILDVHYENITCVFSCECCFLMIKRLTDSLVENWTCQKGSLLQSRLIASSKVLLRLNFQRAFGVPLQSGNNL